MRLPALIPRSDSTHIADLWAVVDELTEDQARGILVPIAKTAAQRAAVKNINSVTLKAVQVKATAVS